MAATLDKLPGWALGLLEEEPVGHLGLLDDEGRPRVLPITFALAGGAVWSAVDDKPKTVPGSELARVRWLRAKPSAALTVDRYSGDWSRLAWVQLIGEVSVVSVEGEDAAVEALASRYPAYRERRPQGPLLRLSPERTVWWSAESGRTGAA